MQFIPWPHSVWLVQRPPALPAPAATHANCAGGPHEARWQLLPAPQAAVPAGVSPVQPVNPESPIELLPATPDPPVAPPLPPAVVVDEGPAPPFPSDGPV